MMLLKKIVSSPLLWGLVVMGSLAAFTFGGKVEAEAINYGHDQCHYCKMGIVDQQHASQLVTEKGKQFKYDAIECMVNEQREHPQKAALMLVSDYGATRMTDAKAATYLISRKIRSPMGANLSGFSSKARADAALKTHGGKLYTWGELKALLGTAP